jgi:hypothetical protein
MYRIGFLRRFVAHKNQPPSKAGHRPVPAYMLDAAWQQFQLHWSASDMLDQKASTLLSAIGVMIALLVSLKPGVPGWNSVCNLIYIAGMAALLISGVFALWAYRTCTYQVLPKPLEIYEWYQHPETENPENDTAAMLIRQIHGAIEGNKPTIQAKEHRLRIAHWSLLVGMILIVARVCTG